MIIMHVDANAAFLSWSAVEALKHGAKTDYREVPSVVGGDESSRHGIVLAKSIPAKKFGISTADTLVDARRKCPNLIVIPPDHELYHLYSDAMYGLLSEYTPIIQRYSIDECFLDYTGSEKIFGDPVKAAYEIKNRMKEELGFTVNIGVSVNRLLAKMASEFEKPDKVHTLFPEEIEAKMWPLPVGELFMVGRRSADKLRKMGIYTIGDLAHADIGMLESNFKSHGTLMHNYANGIDNEPVVSNKYVDQKAYGNSMTIDHDVKDREEAHRYLLRLCDKVSQRLRDAACKASLVSVTIRNSELVFYGRQRQIDVHIDSTDDLYAQAVKIFDEFWMGDAIRLLGVGAGNLLYENDNEQLSIFGQETAQSSAADKAVDAIRERFGKNAIKRGSLVDGPAELRNKKRIT